MMKGFSILWLLTASSAFAVPVISEFMASNETTLADEDGEFPDWIEIYNPDATPVELGGYYLTDDAADLTGWKFPVVTLTAGERLIVFASRKDRKLVAGNLHTDFKLSAGGEYLALVAADGTTVLSDFGTNFPEQFEDVSYGVGDFGEGYFMTPTPGAANSGGTAVGPDFLEIMEGAPRPVPAEDLIITAKVSGASSVMLHYRVDFEEEIAVSMTSTGEMMYSGTIPGGAAGQLLRWRYSAQDEGGLSSKAPAFRSPTDSHEYFGTVVSDPSVESLAPVLEWFIEPQIYSRLLSFVQPARGGVFYLGEYYDNVAFTLHGQSTLFFAKKSFNIDFNRTQRFRWKDGEKRVRDIDLITNWGDKSKVRQPLAFEVMREAGVPTHFAFSVRVQQNGEFFSVADLVEDADDRYLERAGLNPDGALYKAFSSFLEVSDIGGNDGMTKKTRKDEDNSDLHALINGINQTGEARWDYIYDNVDLPTTINTLAAMVVNMQTDMFDKNYYLYRDTGRSDEWAILPWDLDLSFGRIFQNQNGGYFNNGLLASGYTEHEESSDGVVLVDFLIDGNANTRAMFFRRLRTLVDRYLQESSTPMANRYLETRLDELVALLDPPSITPSDAQQDFEKWGSWLDGSPVPVPWTSDDPAVESMREAVTRFKTEWLPARRTEIYTNVADLPAAQANPVVAIGTIEYAPASNNQDEEFIELLNQETVAVDVSDWEVRGGVEITIPAGTVIPAGGTLYLSPNAAAFRARAVAPRGGEQRFVVGPYSGHLSSRGETLDLLNENGVLQDTKTFSGNPSDPQKHLVVSEVYYNPPGEDDAEYIEIFNTSLVDTVDLTGVHFSAGETFDFTGSAITSLGPQGRVLVVKNLAAFETAFGTGLPVAGEFGMGSTLDNGNETVKIEDAKNGTVQEFTYLDEAPWPTAADGTGLSLILFTPLDQPDHALGSSWRAGPLRPGEADPLGFVGDPQVDVDRDGFAALLEYAMGTSDFSFSNLSIPSGGVFTYQNNLAAFDVALLAEVSSDLKEWSSTGIVELSRVQGNDGREQVTVQLPHGSEKCFVRLRAIQQ